MEQWAGGGLSGKSNSTIKRKTTSKKGAKCSNFATEKITGTYNEDYNILYIDEIIRRKLENEHQTILPRLRNEYRELYNTILVPQTYRDRVQALDQLAILMKRITEIEDGTRLQTYRDSVKDILAAYRQCNGKIRVVMFGKKSESYVDFDDETRHKISLIEKFIEIAGQYIEIDVTRVNSRPPDLCIACNTSLSKIVADSDGIIRCPNEDCQAEHPIFITAKLAKDSMRINTTAVVGDESYENFDKAFLEYQGLQDDPPPPSICDELDAYFISKGRPSGAQIRAMPLNSRGRRYDTTPRMLWDTLSIIGQSQYYKDAYYIGKIYWGWVLSDVMHLREKIKYKYTLTQKAFYEIPPCERERSSSIGTQYRLWRQLQLENHECYAEDFKIAENPDSRRIHDKLWRRMCDIAGHVDPEIRYIE